MNNPTQSIIGPSPLLNASGCMCDTKNKLNQLQDSAGITGICSKSATLRHRPGNPDPRYWESPDSRLTINSMGLPNLGVEYYLEWFKSLGHPKSEGKWRCVSLAGLTLVENIEILSIIYSDEHQYYQYIDAIEWNLSCPNLSGHGILAYDFQAMDDYLQRLDTAIQMHNMELSKITHILKLPPYFEPYQFTKVAEIISKYPVFTSINTVNSLPNGLVVDPYTETTVIHPKNGYGGIGGQVIKPTALANVNGLYRAFKELGRPITIIGTGGITCGRDVFEFILCGASLVSIGSQLMMEGSECFARINKELCEFMAERGYQQLDDFRGKLRVTDPLN